jgi:hypothetical protein
VVSSISVVVWLPEERRGYYYKSQLLPLFISFLQQTYTQKNLEKRENNLQKYENKNLIVQYNPSYCGYFEYINN